MDVFDALASPVRREILEVLSGAEMTPGALVSRLEMSQPAVSNQLRVLLQAGLVERRRERQRRVYSLRPEKIQEAIDYLASLMPGAGPAGSGAGSTSPYSPSAEPISPS
jgi:DNA-binding transcriptional ArsR family regulator